MCVFISDHGCIPVGVCKVAYSTLSTCVVAKSAFLCVSSLKSECVCVCVS